VNYDNSFVVTITVTYYSWGPSSGDDLFTCGAIFWPPHLIRKIFENHQSDPVLIRQCKIMYLYFAS